MDLETTVETLAPGLLRFCRGLLHSPAAAEEVAQDALTALVDRWRKHGPPENAEAFVFAIARRRAGRALWRERLMTPFETLFDGHDPAPDPETTTRHRQDLRRALRALRQIPRRNRETLLLVVAGEVDTATAAEVLGISRSAVKMRLHRARRQLDHLLEDER